MLRQRLLRGMATAMSETVRDAARAAADAPKPHDR